MWVSRRDLGKLCGFVGVIEAIATMDVLACGCMDVLACGCVCLGVFACGFTGVWVFWCETGWPGVSPY